MRFLSSSRWLRRAAAVGVTTAAALATATTPAFATPAVKAAPVLTKAQIVKLIKEYQLTGAAGAMGATGTSGLTGPAGAPGPQGVTGVRGVAGTPAPVYVAGSGLTLTGTVFGVSQWAFQSPFTKSCGPYQMVVSATQAGVPTCDFGTVAFSDSTEDGDMPAELGGSSGPLVNSDADDGAMPAGTYFVSGQVTLLNSAATAVTVACSLAVIDADASGLTPFVTSDQTVQPIVAKQASAADVSLTGWYTLTAAAAALDNFSLDCSTPYGAPSGVYAADANITAIPLTSSSSHGT